MLETGWGREGGAGRSPGGGAPHAPCPETVSTPQPVVSRLHVGHPHRLTKPYGGVGSRAPPKGCSWSGAGAIGATGRGIPKGGSGLCTPRCLGKSSWWAPEHCGRQGRWHVLKLRSCLCLAGWACNPGPLGPLKPRQPCARPHTKAAGADVLDARLPARAEAFIGRVHGAVGEQGLGGHEAVGGDPLEMPSLLEDELHGPAGIPGLCPGWHNQMHAHMCPHTCPHTPREHACTQAPIYHACTRTRHTRAHTHT